MNADDLASGCATLCAIAIYPFNVPFQYFRSFSKLEFNENSRVFKEI
jgi:hypothetical protein